MNDLSMQHRRYNIDNKLSDSLSNFDKSDDEICYEDYYQEFNNSSPASGSQIIRRWLLTIIDIPNNLTNKLRDWLRSTPGTRGSTSDKSSGTNSLDTSGIKLTEHLNDNDYFKNDKFDNFLKHNQRHHRSHVEKNFHPPNDSHRYVKKHHFYHIYKQNEIGIERVVERQRNFSTSWLQRNEKFSSSPVLVLPRIYPDTGLPINHPRNKQSRTTTEQRPITHREEIPKDNDWRDKEIWKYQENNYTHLNGDTNFIEGLLETEIMKKGSTTMTKKSESRTDDNQDNKLNFNHVELSKFEKFNEAFSETIAMRVEVKEPQLLLEKIEKKDSMSSKIKNEEKINKKESDKFHNISKLSTVAHNNVDTLLNDLRDKINTMNNEKKFNRPVVRLSSLIDSETGSQDRDHLFSSRWQNKSGLFAKDINSSCMEARASFAERIQDIWTQEKTASQWAILHNHRYIINEPYNRIEKEENFDEEIEIVCNEFTTKDTIKDNKILKMSATQSSINYEITKPSVCHIGVQYSNHDSTNFEKHLRSSTCQYFLTLENDKCQMEIEKPQILKNLIEPNQVSENLIKISPPRQEIQTFVQYEISKLSNKFISTQPNRQLESKASTSELLIEQKKQNNFSTVKNITLENIDIEKSDIPILSQDIQDFVGNSISEIFTTEKYNISKEQNVQKTQTFENLYPENFDDKTSRYSIKRNKRKNLHCPFTDFRKIRLKRSLRLSRWQLINTKKLRIHRCRLPKKIGLWLTSKFHSRIRQENTNFNDSDETLKSTKSSKLTFTMRNIFKCIGKISDNNLSDEKVNQECCSDSTILTSNTRKFTEIGDQSLMTKIDDVNFRDTKYIGNNISETRFIEEIKFNDIEATSTKCKNNPSERSMTTLSVTTSNSTNIPSQLLGSTSDTNIVPSYDSQDYSNRQVDETTNGTDIITINKNIETSEETDHYIYDRFLPESNKEINEKLKKSKFNHDIKTENNYDKIIDKTKKSINIYSDNVNEKSQLERKIRNFDITENLQKPKKRISVNRKQRKIDKTPDNGNIDKKRSFDSEHFSRRKNNLSAMKTSVSDKSAEKNAYKRIERRKSRIDIIGDISMIANSEKSEIRNTHNRRLERRESVLNISNDATENEDKESKTRERKMEYNHKCENRLETTCTTKKFKQRSDSPMIPRRLSESPMISRRLSESPMISRRLIDSPMIPRRSTVSPMISRRSIDSQKRRSITAGKSSLIPVGIGKASRCLSTMSKTGENNATDEYNNNTKLNDHKNGLFMNPSTTARPLLKKSLRDCSESRHKRNSNYRVRFEVDKKYSKEIEFNENKNQIKGINNEENLISKSLHVPMIMDDKKIVKKIKSSLENDEPLKRIIITDPCSVSKDFSYSREIKNNFIDQPRVLKSSYQNSMKRKKLISQVDCETLYQTYPRRESTLSGQTLKPKDSFEKCNRNYGKISYRTLSIENNKNKNVMHYPVKQSGENLPEFIEFEKTDALQRLSVIDFSRIREKVENEILEKTSRNSGTEDCDCAIVLIKAINSSIELSDP